MLECGKMDNICYFPFKTHYFPKLVMNIILNAFKIYQPSCSKGISTWGLLSYLVFKLLNIAGIKKIFSHMRNLRKLALMKFTQCWDSAIWNNFMVFDPEKISGTVARGFWDSHHTASPVTEAWRRKILPNVSQPLM